MNFIDPALELQDDGTAPGVGSDADTDSKFARDLSDPEFARKVGLITQAFLNRPGGAAAIGGAGTGSIVELSGPEQRLAKALMQTRGQGPMMRADQGGQAENAYQFPGGFGDIDFQGQPVDRQILQPYGLARGPVAGESDSSPPGTAKSTADENSDRPEEAGARTPSIDYDQLIVPRRGPAYRQDQIAAQSHYNDPIDQSDGRLAGRSRISGDASPETQRAAIDAIVASAKKAGLSTRDTAHVLAIAQLESGFNPDAAAGTSSACGLGQILRGTEGGYGLGDGNRWDMNDQSDALVKLFLFNKNLARTRGQGEEYIYKYHHDGPSKEGGGLAIARNRKLMDRVDRYEQVLDAGAQ